jgi:hypothetical protein
LTGSGYDPFSGRLEYTHASLHNGGSPVAVQNLVDPSPYKEERTHWPDAIRQGMDTPYRWFP